MMVSPRIYAIYLPVPEDLMSWNRYKTLEDGARFYPREEFPGTEEYCIEVEKRERRGRKWLEIRGKVIWGGSSTKTEEQPFQGLCDLGTCYGIIFAKES